MVTEHPTSRAALRGTRSYAAPRQLLIGYPSKDGRRCLRCGCVLYSRSDDDHCWSCRRIVDEEALTACEADETTFRLMLLIRLVHDFGPPPDPAARPRGIDLAEYFQTTNRQRIYEAVKYWRRRGWVINGYPDGGYRVVGYEEKQKRGTT